MSEQVWSKAVGCMVGEEVVPKDRRRRRRRVSIGMVTPDDRYVILLPTFGASGRANESMRPSIITVERLMRDYEPREVPR